MGNCGRKFKNIDVQQETGPRNVNQKIGREIQCPTCQRVFPRTATYLQFNQHLDNCLQTEPNERNKLEQNLQEIWEQVEEDGKWQKRKIRIEISDQELKMMDAHEAEFLTFEEKLKWLRFKLDSIRVPFTLGADQIKITSLENILEETIQQMKGLNFHRETKIQFVNDEAQDAGGIIREWINIILRKLFSKEKNYFSLCKTQELNYTINPEINYNNDNKLYYRLAGKIIGKAVFEKIPIEPVFNKTLIKHMIGQKLMQDDMKHFDEKLYEGWKHLQQNAKDLNLDFVIQYKKNNQLLSHPLIENARDTEINETNFKQYIQLCNNFYLKENIEPALSEFLEEFHNIVPINYLIPFSVKEFEYVLNGIPFLDFNDWKINTIYKGQYTEDSQVIQWFWNIMKTLDQQQLKLILKFCTGSTRVPIEGFAKLESSRGEIALFTIQSLDINNEKNIKSHTCFNRLEIPVF